MPLRQARTPLQNVAIGTLAVLCVAGTRFVPTRETPGAARRVAAAMTPAEPEAAYLADAARAAADPDGAPAAVAASANAAGDAHAVELTAALGTLGASVARLSHPTALESAFRSYYAYRAAHPGARLKPYLYFVDYGLPSTAPRGYLFDMAALRVVEGPFTVAHGRGSSPGDGVPRRFSNVMGSASTSLGLYVAQELYAFRGKSAGRAYASTGLRLAGLSGAFNDRARVRGVVAHGAPYVTSGRAGRSEGCPAMEPARAERLLPKLAGGGLVFLFAPDARWMASEPWTAGRAG